MTYKELMEVFDTTKKEVSTIHSEVENIQYSVRFNSRFNKALGRCTKVGYNSYLIEINPTYANMVELSSLKNTIVHEIIHSLPRCMNHGPIWKEKAAKMATLGYTIKRVSVETNYSQYRKNNIKYKYIVYCPDCGREWKKQKSSAVTQRPERYICPCGKQNLKVKLC